VRDWQALARAHLTGHGLPAHREADIFAEVAEHLEDVYARALHDGCSDEEATRLALAQVNDWNELARAVSRAEQGGDVMSDDGRRVLVPGLASMIAATGMSFGAVPLLPPEWWTSEQAAVHIALTGLLLAPYLACGAAATWWSRRAGGSIRQRLLACVFPLSLNVAIVAGATGFETRFSPGRFPEIPLGVILAFVVAPGIALALGALPFLRDRSMLHRG